MENQMKHIIALIATAFAVSAFAADAPKAPVATPAVTKADAPVPAALKKDEKKPVKSDTKSGDKKAATPATPAPAASK
jgi:hypothetical protein